MKGIPTYLPSRAHAWLEEKRQRPVWRSKDKVKTGTCRQVPTITINNVSARFFHKNFILRIAGNTWRDSIDLLQVIFLLWNCLKVGSPKLPVPRSICYSLKQLIKCRKHTFITIHQLHLLNAKFSEIQLRSDLILSLLRSPIVFFGNKVHTSKRRMTWLN